MSLLAHRRRLEFVYEEAPSAMRLMSAQFLRDTRTLDVSGVPGTQHPTPLRLCRDKYCVPRIPIEPSEPWPGDCYGSVVTNVFLSFLQISWMTWRPPETAGGRPPPGVVQWPIM